MNTAFAAGSIYVAASGTAEIDPSSQDQSRDIEENISPRDSFDVAEIPVARSFLPAESHTKGISMKTVVIPASDGSRKIEIRMPSEMELFELDPCDNRPVSPDEFAMGMFRQELGGSYSIDFFGSKDIASKPMQYWAFDNRHETMYPREGCGLGSVVLKEIQGYWETMEGCGPFSEEITLLAESPLRVVANCHFSPEHIRVDLFESLPLLTADGRN